MQHPAESGLGKGDLVRNKRHLGVHDDIAPQGAMSEKKRKKTPALASVVVEAVKMDHLQKLCSILEPILRRVVREEVERALARLTASNIESRTPPKQIQVLGSSNLRLRFRNKVSLPLFTGSKVEGEQGLPVHIALEDGSTGLVVSRGPESAVKLEVVVLDGDFNNDEEDWTEEDFENKVVKERDGKRPLLTGDLVMTLKEGVGTLGELIFTDNSSWIRSRKFRLGVRAVSGFSKAIRIQECRTEAFTVKDHRGELYKKHYPPALNDEVWRLDKIGKDGAFHKRLNVHHIQTVEDFLRHYVVDKQNLRHVLGGGMSKKMWESTVEHAKTCNLSSKVFAYYADISRNIGVIFNNIYELMGITSHGHYKSVDSLTENEKVYVDKLVKVAYENWASVMEYDSKTLVSETHHHHETESGENMENLRGLDEHLLMFSQQEHSSSKLMRLDDISASSAVSSGSGSGSTAQSYDHWQEAFTGFTVQDHPLIQSSQIPNGNEVQGHAPSIVPEKGMVSGNEASMTGLALGPPLSMISRAFPFQSIPISPQASQAGITELGHGQVQDPLIPARHVNELIEEEICENSVEVPKNDEMQHLLRLQYSSVSDLQGDDMNPLSGIPSASGNFCADHSQTSGKAYVGWLKLKAALHWGIFIRKIAAKKAARRAQLAELED